MGNDADTKNTTPHSFSVTNLVKFEIIVKKGFNFDLIDGGYCSLAITKGGRKIIWFFVDLDMYLIIFVLFLAG